MESSQFSEKQPRFDSIEQMETKGATCDTFRVKLYGKLHFLKRLKPTYTGDIRYQEALRKEFETGYRLEHPNLVRYVSLDESGILMEYVDGEPLSHRLDNDPDYFRQRKNTEKFVRQLLDVLGYLHSHQVLHLDLKPDNILLTHINNDVKLIDLGFCYTDTFADTQGYTNAFAAPEQLNGDKVDVRSDIYAFGKILEILPVHHIYNKVIDRCTAERPEDRYQSVDEILHTINHQRRYFLWVAIIVFIAALLSVGLSLLTHQKNEPVIIEKMVVDSVVPEKHEDKLHDSVQQNHEPVPAILQPKSQIPKKDEQSQYQEDMERMMDEAYRSTIATFCDSAFPSPHPTTGKAWANASTEFHNQATQIADRLAKRYPNIPETSIRQESESRFQSLVSSVFNQMRQNGKQ
ncbi:MAG: serine/threonine protein kinase [Paludibacteraceae bacterium]|nr:serine/threonine protein kinase [Paludibacteraceae bacterium]